LITSVADALQFISYYHPLDYIEARHADTLRKIETAANGPVRLLVAARIGRTRLIDNVAV
jgi:pantoate--beta-alanine ligase